MLVGEATRAAESAIVFEPIGDHSLKGKTSPFRVAGHSRGGRRGGQGRADALEAPLVGATRSCGSSRRFSCRRPEAGALVSITGRRHRQEPVSGAREVHRRRREDTTGTAAGRPLRRGRDVLALGEMVRRAQLTRMTTRDHPTSIEAARRAVPDGSERERIVLRSSACSGRRGLGGGARRSSRLAPALRGIAEKGTRVVFEDLQWPIGPPRLHRPPPRLVAGLPILVVTWPG